MTGAGAASAGAGAAAARRRRCIGWRRVPPAPLALRSGREPTLRACRPPLAATLRVIVRRIIEEWRKSRRRRRRPREIPLNDPFYASFLCPSNIGIALLHVTHPSRPEVPRQENWTPGGGVASPKPCAIWALGCRRPGGCLLPAEHRWRQGQGLGADEPRCGKTGNSPRSPRGRRERSFSLSRCPSPRSLRSPRKIGDYGRGNKPRWELPGGDGCTGPGIGSNWRNWSFRGQFKGSG